MRACVRDTGFMGRKDKKGDKKEGSAAATKIVIGAPSNFTHVKCAQRSHARALWR